MSNLFFLVPCKLFLEGQLAMVGLLGKADTTSQKVGSEATR